MIKLVVRASRASFVYLSKATRRRLPSASERVCDDHRRARQTTLARRSMASILAGSALFGALATGALRLPISRRRARALRIVVALLLALNARAFPGVWQCVPLRRRCAEHRSIRVFKTIVTLRIRARLLRLGFKRALPPQSRALELGIQPRWQWNASIGQASQRQRGSGADRVVAVRHGAESGRHR